jgi:hypothetical protein
VQIQLGRGSLVRTGGNAIASSLSTKAKAVIRTNQPFAIVHAHAQRNTPVRTNVSRHDNVAVNAIGHQCLIQQSGSVWGLSDFFSKRDGIPVTCQQTPILRFKRAAERQCKGFLAELGRAVTFIVRCSLMEGL